jgi:hypothetical protein
MEEFSSFYVFKINRVKQDSVNLIHNIKFINKRFHVLQVNIEVICSEKWFVKYYSHDHILKFCTSS